MDMFTSYGHIKKTKENYRLFDDFSLIVSLQENTSKPCLWYDNIGKRCSILHLFTGGHFEIGHND